MKRVNLLLATLILFIGAVPALAHGDRIITQMADGAGVIRTKIDITNLSPEFSITQLRVMFFRPNGNPWSLETNRGSFSETTLTLGRFQTIRIETRGTTPDLTSGYAIVRNTDSTSVYPEDFDVAITVFYEILNGPNVVDTVSVPLGLPTFVWVLPVEIDVPKELLTGFAIVNLDDAPNKVSLRLWEATEPSTADARDGGMIEFTMNPKEQRARFLNEPGLFPGRTKFKGMLVGFSERPVSILALLQTPTPSGVQYATLAAVRLDYLRRNTFIYLPQGFALNADIPVVDYYYDETVSRLPDGYDDYTWDLRYETVSNSRRRLVPRSGAAIAAIGSRDNQSFEALQFQEIAGLPYSTNPIEMDDNSENLKPGFTFAIRTGLGRYARVRIFNVDSPQGTNYRDLALQIFVYK